MEHIIEILNGAQSDTSYHKGYVNQLKKLVHEGTAKDRKSKWEFLKKGCIDQLLIHSRSDSSIDNSIKFMSEFILSLDDEEMKYLVDHLCHRLMSSNKLVRQRSCDIIATTFTEAAESNIDIGCDVLDMLTLALVKKLHDKAPAVRIAALKAIQPLQNVDDPSDEVINEICKVMTSDSSANVRIAAVDVVYFTELSLSKLVIRIRDIKRDVRIAAIKKISTVPISKLNSGFRAAIVRHGFTDRDAKVRSAAQDLVVAWLDMTNKSVSSLIRILNPILYEEEVIMVAAYLARGSGAEADLDAMGGSVAEWTLEAASAPSFLSDIIWTFLRCNYARGLHDALVGAEICDNFLPDAIAFCRLIDQMTLNDAALSDKKSRILKYLLKTSSLTDPADLGGIEQLLSLYRAILARKSLPYDLVEVALKAHLDLSRVHRQSTDFAEQYIDQLISLAMEVRTASPAALDPSSGDDADEEYSPVERSLQMLHFALKSVADRHLGTKPTWIAQTDTIVPLLMEALQQMNSNVRCIAVSCIGLVCMTSESLCEKYRPIILQVASGGFEEDVVVCVAVQSLADISMVHREKMSKHAYEVCNVLSRLLQDSETELVRIASESAAKLLFSGCIDDSQLLSNLLKFFFVADFLPAEADERDSSMPQAMMVTKAGGVDKLQQLLTLFFKTFLFTGDRCEQLLLNAVPLLVADLTGAFREGTVQPSTMSKVVKYLMDFCAGIDNNVSEEGEGGLEYEGEGEGEELSPMTKRKRTTSRQSVLDARKTKGGQSASPAGLGQARVTAKLKERLFAALSRDVLKLGGCANEDRLLVKEYVRLIVLVTDREWICADSVNAVRKIVANIKSTIQQEKASVKVLDKMVASWSHDVDLTNPSRDANAYYDRIVSMAPGLGDLLALLSQSHDSDAEEDGAEPENDVPSVCSRSTSRSNSSAARKPNARVALERRTSVRSVNKLKSMKEVSTSESDGEESGNDNAAEVDDSATEVTECPPEPLQTVGKEKKLKKAKENEDKNVRPKKGASKASKWISGEENLAPKSAKYTASVGYI